MSAAGGETLGIAVFARTPVPNTAKTRLIPRLGAVGAARLQAQLTLRAVARACEVAPRTVSLWWAGDDPPPPPAGVEIFYQRGANLGARMIHAFDNLLSRYARVLLVGTDCPAQTPADLRAAHEALHIADVVLQPAEDGGYVLVGIKQQASAEWRTIFDDVAWGTGTVLAQTLARLAQTRLTHHLLSPRPDLDTPADYDRAIAAGWITP